MTHLSWSRGEKISAKLQKYVIAQSVVVLETVIILIHYFPGRRIEVLLTSPSFCISVSFLCFYSSRGICNKLLFYEGMSYAWIRACCHFLSIKLLLYLMVKTQADTHFEYEWYEFLSPHCNPTRSLQGLVQNLSATCNTFDPLANLVRALHSSWSEHSTAPSLDYFRSCSTSSKQKQCLVSYNTWGTWQLHIYENIKLSYIASNRKGCFVP